MHIAIGVVLNSILSKDWLHLPVLVTEAQSLDLALSKTSYNFPSYSTESQKLTNDLQ